MFKGSWRNKGERHEVNRKKSEEGGTIGVAAFVRIGQVGVGPTVVLQTIDTAHYTARAQPVLAPGLSGCRLCKQCCQFHLCCLQ